VAASNRIEHVPADLVPHSYAEAVSRPNLGFPPSQCVQGAGDDSVPACVFGDTSASRTVVLYGDSHAGMWFHAFDDIAQRDGWKLVVLFKEGCPASLISVRLPLVAQDFTQCDAWHRNVLQRINALDPDVLVVTQEIDSAPDGTYFSPSQWQGAMQDLLTTAKAGRKVVLGDIPITPGPLCVSRFPKTVQQCSRPPGNGLHGYNGAERAAAQAAHATYVDVTPWFCARRCSSVIGNFNVYWNPYHVAVGYTEFLEGVLAHALGL